MPATVTPQRNHTGAASGLAQALRAASADVAGALDPRPHPAVDALELRDPEYIRRTLPGLRAMSQFYFRAEVRGMSNITRRLYCSHWPTRHGWRSPAPAPAPQPLSPSPATRRAARDRPESRSLPVCPHRSRDRGD